MGVIGLVDPIEGCTLGDSTREALATIARALVEFGRVRPETQRAVGNVFAPEQLGLELRPGRLPLWLTPQGRPV